jgi:hypothetical protein
MKNLLIRVALLKNEVNPTRLQVLKIVCGEFLLPAYHADILFSHFL